MNPGSDEGTERATDVYKRVIDGVTDAADIGSGRASCRPDNARFYQSDTERREHQDHAHKKSEGNRVADRSQPGGADRAQCEIGGGKNQISQRQCAPESKTVGNCTTEDGQKPDQAAEKAGKARGAFGREVPCFMEIAGKRSECCVIGETLEKFADIGDPERPLENQCEFP